MYLRHAVAGALALALLAVAGCGSKPAAPPQAPQPSAPSPAAPPAAPPRASIKTTMATGGKGALVYLQPAVAEYAGFFKEEGLDIEVQDTKGGADAAKALIGGSVDFASMAVDHTIKAKTQGVDLVVLALYTRYTGVSLLVHNKHKDKVKTPRDLKGLKVGVTSKGSGTHLALNATLVKFGLKPDDVEVVAVGTSTMPAAFENGTIDATMNADPYITLLVQQGKGYIIYDLTQTRDTLDLYGSDYPFTALVTRKEVLQKNPEAVQRMVNALAKAIKFVASKKPAEIAAVLPKEFKQPDEALYLAALAHSQPALSPDGLVDARGIETVIKSLKTAGDIKADASIDAASLFDLSFLKKAMGK